MDINTITISAACGVGALLAAKPITQRVKKAKRFAFYRKMDLEAERTGRTPYDKRTVLIPGLKRLERLKQELAEMLGSQGGDGLPESGASQAPKRVPEHEGHEANSTYGTVAAIGWVPLEVINLLILRQVISPYFGSEAVGPWVVWIPATMWAFGQFLFVLLAGAKWPVVKNIARVMLVFAILSETFANGVAYWQIAPGNYGALMISISLGLIVPIACAGASFVAYECLIAPAAGKGKSAKAIQHLREMIEELEAQFAKHRKYLKDLDSEEIPIDLEKSEESPVKTSAHDTQSDVNVGASSKYGLSGGQDEHLANMAKVADELKKSLGALSARIDEERLSTELVLNQVKQVDADVPTSPVQLCVTEYSRLTAKAGFAHGILSLRPLGEYDEDEVIQEIADFAKAVSNYRSSLRDFLQDRYVVTNNHNAGGNLVIDGRDMASLAANLRACETRRSKLFQDLSSVESACYEAQQSLMRYLAMEQLALPLPDPYSKLESLHDQMNSQLSAHRALLSRLASEVQSSLKTCQRLSNAVQCATSHQCASCQIYPRLSMLRSGILDAQKVAAQDLPALEKATAHIQRLVANYRVRRTRLFWRLIGYPERQMALITEAAKGTLSFKTQRVLLALPDLQTSSWRGDDPLVIDGADVR